MNFGLLDDQIVRQPLQFFQECLYRFVPTDSQSEQGMFKAVLMLYTYGSNEQVHQLADQLLSFDVLVPEITVEICERDRRISYTNAPVVRSKDRAESLPYVFWG